VAPGEVDVLLGHRVPAGLALLLDRVDAAEIIVNIIGYKIIIPIDYRRKLRAAAESVVLMGERDHGRYANIGSCPRNS